MILTKQDKLEQLKDLYEMSIRRLENDEASEVIVVPYSRGDERVEILYTKRNGEQYSQVIHDPL